MGECRGYIFSLFLYPQYSLSVGVRCKGLVRLRLNIFGMVSFRVICNVHTGSHQGAHEVSCPTFNDSEFDHLIKGASHYSALTPSHLDGPVPWVYEAPCCANICQES